MFTAAPIRVPSLFKYALLLLPFLEIAGFIIVGRAIGVFATLFLIIASAVAGMTILRTQSALAMWRMSQSPGQQGDPQQMLDGFFMMMAGLLLLIPGFITDTLGLLLLLPGVRTVCKSWLLSHNMVQHPASKPSQSYSDESKPKSKGGNVIEGECWREDDKDQ